MKRDMELVIKILKVVEEHESGDSFTLSMEDEGYSDELVQYHLEIMTDAGLINTIDATTFDGKQFIIQGMTWDGHDFLEAARNANVVERAKEMAKSKGLEFSSLPFEVAKDFLVASIKGLLGLQ